MTISNTYAPYTAIGNGVTTVFSSSAWGVLNSSHLKVALENIATGTQTAQVISTNYTLAFTTNSFSVTFLVAPASTQKVVIYRDVPETQDEPYKTTNGFDGQTLENSFDKLTQITQQLQDGVDRSVRFSVGSSLATEINPLAYKGKALGFNSSTGALEPLALSDGSSTSVIATNTTASRNLANRFGDVLNLKDFGAVGDYSTDDTSAINSWLSACSTYNKLGYAPSGNYKLTNNILWPDGVKVVGDGSARIATFPQLGGANSNKRKLRPSYKNTMTGTNFIFTGTPSNTFTTTRSDKFSNIKPCVIYNYYTPISIDGISIIQDMDVLDSGGSLTTGSTDNRASNYTAGFLSLATQCAFKDVNIFGYFADAGLIICNKDADSFADPDYNCIIDCLISSGLAIIGTDVTAVSEGLTGLMASNSGFYGADHHTRADGLYTVNSLYIDGNLSSSHDIRGHNFVNCHFRTYANEAIKFDQCDDISLTSCTFEFSALSGVTNADQNGTIIGTSNTGDVRIISPQATSGMGIETLANTISGSLLSFGAENDQDVIISQSGKGVRIRGESLTGDSVIQFTDDFSSSTTQWTIRRDDSVSDLLDIRWNNVTVASLTTGGLLSSRGLIYDDGGSKTISSGVITITHSNHSVATEGGAGTDDLDTINGGVTGQVLILRAGNSSNDVVAKDGTGNLRLSADFTLTHAQDRIVLLYDGTNWVELSRSDNTA